ncbi:MAG: glycosyltransferase [Candidatus Bathyarchaeota archaeon]|nr:MAG: glycosyltransferase [Candidatus Bathyarchaeota archaeon]
MINDFLSVASIYTVIVGTYFGVRLLLHFFNKPYKKPHHTSSTLAIPVYQENPEHFERCLRSCIDEKPDEIIVVDDGSKDLKCYEIASAYSKTNPSLKVVRFEMNAGKRFAQAYAFLEAKGEIIVTVDSDTQLQNGSLAELTKPFQNKRIGAVAGLLTAENSDDNALTKVLSMRYIIAGVFERAAYSYFQVVNCASGPLSAYRRSLILNNLQAYIGQVHRGKRCTFGDDRHLTGLILKSGFNVFFQKTAMAYTVVPNRLGKFATQQLRWNRSFWRENWFSLHWMWRRSKYLTMGTIMDSIMPFLYLGSLFWSLWNHYFSLGLFLFVPYIATASLMAYIRHFEYFRLTRKKDYLIAPIYAWLHTFLLLPISLFALFTTNKTGWGTR